MWEMTRREFLMASAGTAAGLMLGGRALAGPPPVKEVPHGERPVQDKTVTVLNPRGRVPLSFIIDDSTCLVNMGAFCMPQFNAAWPQNPAYWKKWQKWPREIPNDFVREFGEWCAEQGVRGKYSLIPYPACVGWLDRGLPGWSQKDLKESLNLVRELMAPRWELHPEMATHTRIIDLKTGRPMAEMNPATMENSYPPKPISVDQYAEYVAYALRILKNAEIPCQGITTPGGFGNAAKAELSAGVGQAVRDVFNPEIPHYFKYVADGPDESTQPLLEHVSGLETENPKLVVNVIAGTGDWFGNWDGDSPPQGEKYSNDDATSGRLVDLIEKGEPATMLCHWAGLYSHGSKKGFEACKKVILGINGRYRDKTIWMKTSELARYWAARELTKIERNGGQVALSAPFGSPGFSIRIANAGAGEPKVTSKGERVALKEVMAMVDLKDGTWIKDKGSVVVCMDLQKGQTQVSV
jgi:hypothetical protein